MAQATETPSHLQDPKRLRRRRAIAGLNQKQAAAQANIAQSHLCRMEKGKAGASEATLHALAQLYECPVEALMPDEDGGDEADVDD